LVWVEAGVSVELDAPLQATSTSHEPAVATVALAARVLMDVPVLVIAVGTT
jgi:hypothetical protein